MATAPIVAVSDTGTEPLDSTVDALETEINAGFVQAYDELVQVDVLPNAGAMINLPKATGTENALVTVKPVPFDNVPLAGDQKFWLRPGLNNTGPTTLDLGEGTGPLPLLQFDGSEMAAGDIQSNIRYQVRTVQQSGAIIEYRLTGPLWTKTEKTKLAGIASDATANDSDAALRDRATHTGEQPMSSITGLQDALANAGDADALASVAERIEYNAQKVIGWSGSGAGRLRLYSNTNNQRFVDFPQLRVMRDGVAIVTTANTAPVALPVPSDGTIHYYYIDIASGIIGYSTSFAQAEDGPGTCYLGLATKGRYSDATGMEVLDADLSDDLVADELAARVAADDALATGLADAARFQGGPRPGGNPEAYSASAPGEPAVKVALSAQNVETVDGLGACYVVRGEGAVWGREPVLIGTDVVEIEALIRRVTNPVNSADVSVQLQVTWLDKNLNGIGTTLLVSEAAPMVADGPILMSHRISALSVPNVIAPPAGAVFAVPGIKTFSADTETAVALLRHAVVTDLHTIETNDLSQLLAETTAARDAANAAASSVSKVTLDSAAALRAYVPATGVGEVALRYLDSAGDGLGGTFAVDPSDAASADDGIDVIVDGDSPAGRWKRVDARVGQGFTRLAGRERIRRLEERFKAVVDVQDFAGVDPSGGSSSLAAVQAAVNEWRSYSVGGGQCSAVLYFPPNMDAAGQYVLDGSLDMTGVRGQINTVLAHGAVFLGSGAGKVIFDTTHSNQIDWHGGHLIGDVAAPPKIGLQLARQFLSGTPDSNPSSHHHRLDGLAITGHWTEGCIYNYASEELLATYIYLRNERPDAKAYCLIQDGQSGVFSPTSEFRPAGFAEYTGFANNVWDKCSFWRDAVDGGGVSGPAIFLSRAQGHEFRGCLTQTRGAPTVVVHHVAGERGLQDIRFDCRCETEASTAVLHFTGDAGGVHRGLDVRLDRMFAQRLFEVDPALPSGSVDLVDLEVRVRNLFPGAASAHPSGHVEVFADPAKFGSVSGDLRLANRTTAETGFVAMEGLALDSFAGRLKVADRDGIGAWPQGNYVLADETGQPDAQVREDDGIVTLAVEDAVGNASATQVSAKVWRIGNRMHMTFRNYDGIAIAGLNPGDGFHIPLPWPSVSEYATGAVVMTGLVNPPTGGAGTQDQLRVVCNLNADFATVQVVDATGSTPTLEVGHIDGASIKEFRLEWDIA